MAKMIPDRPLPGTRRQHQRLFQLLKKLPDNFVVFQTMAPSEPETSPAFWLHNDDGRVVFLAVCRATAAEVRNLLLNPKLGLAEWERLQQFVLTLDAESVPSIATAVVFPALRRKQLETIPRPPEAHFLSRDDLKPDGFCGWLEHVAGSPLSAAKIEQLRSRLAVDVVVGSDMTVRPEQSDLSAQWTPFVLDYDQERAVKQDLRLTAEGQSAYRTTNVRLIKGVAGSGKSLILLYRLRFLKQYFPRKRALVVTHNKALILDLRRRYETLTGEPSSDHWFTFLGWCRWLWGDERPWVNPIYDAQQLDLVREVHVDHLADSAFSAELLRDEINWTKDQLFFGLEAYLAADRSGRRFPLNELMRRRVHRAMSDYQDRLRQRGQLDWGDVPRHIWRWVEDGSLTLPQYDFILVDEAQFFAPIWFELLKRAIRSTGSQLFLVADPSQGFLKRRISWQASGLAVRGRSVELRRSYRTTRQIMEFANLFYARRLPDDDDYLEPEAADMPNGILPQLIVTRSTQDAISQLQNEIRALEEANFDLGHMLVIHATYEGAKTIAERLRQALGEDRVQDPRDPQRPGALRVVPLNAATGLESPVVIVMGINRLYEREHNLALTPAEREEAVRDNTRRLYMAMTRAGQRLFFITVGSLPESLKMMPFDM